MVNILIILIQVVARLLSILVIADAILSYFMSPFHPVRVAIGRIVNPMLAPIRRYVPAVSMIDFSPLILLVLINIVEFILVSLLINLR